MLLATRHPHSIHFTCTRPPSPPDQARMHNALGNMHCTAWLLGPCRGISVQITCHIPRTRGNGGVPARDRGRRAAPRPSPGRTCPSSPSGALRHTRTCSALTTQPFGPFSQETLSSQRHDEGRATTVPAQAVGAGERADPARRVNTALCAHSTMLKNALAQVT